MRTGFLITALLMLTSCASIVAGSTDSVKIATSPPSQATCSLANKRGEWSAASGDATEVKRSRTALDISCADNATGAKGSTKLDSGVEPWAFGNILIGGLIGLGVDWSTGAAYDYPEGVSVPLSQSQAVADPAPQAAAPAEQPVYAAPQPSAPFSAETQAIAPAASTASPQGAIAAPPVFVPPGY